MSNRYVISLRFFEWEKESVSVLVLRPVLCNSPLLRKAMIFFLFFCIKKSLCSAVKFYVFFEYPASAFSTHIHVQCYLKFSWSSRGVPCNFIFIIKNLDRVSDDVIIYWTRYIIRFVFRMSTLSRIIVYDCHYYGLGFNVAINTRVLLQKLPPGHSIRRRSFSLTDCHLMIPNQCHCALQLYMYFSELTYNYLHVILR